MYNRHNVKSGTRVTHIVVHCTGTRQDMRLQQLDKLPYHYLITKAGKLLSLKPVGAKDSRIEIAWLGGVNRCGKHTDNRTDSQKKTLFNTLLLLSERCDNAEIIAAGQLYPFGYANPCFDLTQWLAEYIPQFLLDV